MPGRTLAAVGFGLLTAAFIGYMVIVIIGLVDALPEGVIGLLAIAGFAVLFIKVLKDRLTSEEDNYYSKNVKQ